MKKLILLSLFLLAGIFTLSNITKATDATVDLEITGTPGSCVIGSNINLSSKPFSTSTFDFTGNFNTASGNNNWICYDTFGGAAWNLSVLSSALTGVNGGATISASNVKMTVTTVAQSNQSISFAFLSGQLLSETAINTSKKVFEKTSGLSTFGTLTANGVLLKVTIPSAQDIDNYDGIITIGVPTLQ